MKIEVGRDRYVQLPDGRYRVKMVDIFESKSECGPCHEWVFEVVGGRFHGCRLNGRTNRHNAWAPRHKAGQWYFALTGQRLQEGAVVETDELIGKTAWAEIKSGRSKKGKPSNHIELIPPDFGDSNEHST